MRQVFGGTGFEMVSLDKASALQTSLIDGFDIAKQSRAEVERFTRYVLLPNTVSRAAKVLTSTTSGAGLNVVGSMVLITPIGFLHPSRGFPRGFPRHRHTLISRMNRPKNVWLWSEINQTKMSNSGVKLASTTAQKPPISSLVATILQRPI